MTKNNKSKAQFIQPDNYLKNVLQGVDMAQVFSPEAAAQIEAELQSKDFFIEATEELNQLIELCSDATAKQKEIYSVSLNMKSGAGIFGRTNASEFFKQMNRIAEIINDNPKAVALLQQSAVALQNCLKMSKEESEEVFGVLAGELQKFG